MERRERGGRDQERGGRMTGLEETESEGAGGRRAVAGREGCGGRRGGRAKRGQGGHARRSSESGSEALAGAAASRAARLGLIQSLAPRLGAAPTMSLWEREVGGGRTVAEGAGGGQKSNSTGPASAGARGTHRAPPAPAHHRRVLRPEQVDGHEPPGVLRKDHPVRGRRREAGRAGPGEWEAEVGHDTVFAE